MIVSVSTATAEGEVSSDNDCRLGFRDEKSLM